MKALFLLLVCAPAFAASNSVVKRGDLEIRVRVTGTVVPDDVFRIKSTIEGRVETVDSGTFTWKNADQPLSFLAHKELAAMIDSKTNQNIDLMEDRWQRVYRPTPVRCPDTCFILKNFARKGTWVKPQTVMFEAARTLKMVARVRPEDAPWIRDGQDLVFWPLKDPKRRLKGRVTRYVLDIQGDKVSPGASFVLTMSPDRYFDPGTEWEGEIVPLSKKDVLIVPTGALVHGPDGATYLPVRVSTGITTAGLTELSGGIEEKRDILVLDDEVLKKAGAERHKQEVDLDAIRRRLREQTGDPLEPEAALEDLGKKPTKKVGKHAQVLDDTDYGEDPYAEPN